MSARLRRAVARTGACALLAAVALLAGVVAAQAVTVTDDRGKKLRLQGPAQRVVSLAPFTTELVFSIGAGDRLVAVSEHSDYPPAARELPRISNAFSVNLEELLALRPDLVLSWKSGVDPRVVERLEEIGIPVLVLEPRTLADVPRSLQRIGALMGADAAAGRQAKEFKATINDIADRYASRAPLRVFYQISQRPLMTLNGEHMVTTILELCGGLNVFAGLPAIAPTVNREQVLARDPEVVLISASRGRSPESMAYWSRYPAMTAVKAGNLFAVDADTVNRQTPRLAQGARRICALLEQARNNLGSK